MVKGGLVRQSANGKDKCARFIVQLLDMREAALRELRDPELARELERCVAKAVGAYVAPPESRTRPEESLHDQSA